MRSLLFLGVLLTTAWSSGCSPREHGMGLLAADEETPAAPAPAGEDQPAPDGRERDPIATADDHAPAPGGGAAAFLPGHGQAWGTPYDHDGGIFRPPEPA